MLFLMEFIYKSWYLRIKGGNILPTIISVL